MSKLRSDLVLGAVIFGLFAGVAQANLINDAGFEQPTVPVSGATVFPVGSVLAGAWTVVGAGNGNVAIDSTTFGAFRAEEGIQELDLTGNTDNNASTGVEQSFNTTAGTQYSLSFYLGCLFNASYSLPGPASAVVKLNGVLFETATNNNLSGTTPYWEFFDYTFTATGPATTLDIINNTESGVGWAGLDNIVINQAAPEPVTSGLVLGSLTMLGCWATKRRRASGINY